MLHKPIYDVAFKWLGWTAPRVILVVFNPRTMQRTLEVAASTSNYRDVRDDLECLIMPPTCHAYIWKYLNSVLL